MSAEGERILRYAGLVPAAEAPQAGDQVEWSQPPAAPVMPGGESTSALLRQTQTALAASQADLTRVEQERDEALSAFYLAEELRLKAMAELTRTERERDQARAAVADVEGHRKLAAERLTRAEQERDEARSDIEHLTKALAIFIVDNQELRSDRDEVRDEARRLRFQLGCADARIRHVERERNSLARRLGVRFEEKQALEAELVSARTELAQRQAERDKAYAANGQLLDELAEAATHHTEGES